MDIRTQANKPNNCTPNQLDPCQQVNPKFVPIASLAAVAAGTATAKTQEPVFLKNLILGSDQDFVIDDIQIGNQSLNCSDSSIAGSMFKGHERNPAIGVAVDGNVQMSISATLDAAGDLEGLFSCEAVDAAPSIQAQQAQLNKYFGMGKVNIAAGASAQLSAQCLRGGVFLKSLVVQVHGGGPLANATDGMDIVITDITIKGRSIFTGQTGDVVGSIGLDTFVKAGFVGINTLIDTNERVVISLTNKAGAGAVDVSAGFFCQ